MARQSLLHAQLNAIVNKTLNELGDRATVRSACYLAQDEATKIVERYAADVAVGYMEPLFRRAFKATTRRDGRSQPRFAGFEDITWPRRIAVPPIGHETLSTEESDGVDYVVLSTATLADLERNVKMRRAIDSASVIVTDKFDALARAARAAGATDDDVVSQILRSGVAGGATAA